MASDNQADARRTDTNTKQLLAFLDRVPDLRRLYKLVVKQVASRWERLTTMLELDNDGRKIDVIRRDFWGAGVEICCMQAIHHWVRGEGKRPVSWRTLLKCLDDIECREIAEEIRIKLIEGKEHSYSYFYNILLLLLLSLSLSLSLWWRWRRGAVGEDSRNLSRDFILSVFNTFQMIFMKRSNNFRR